MKAMLFAKYLQAAMKRAKYEILEEDEGYYGSIPELPGTWATGATLEACREELESVAEGWLLLGLEHTHWIPIIDHIDLNPAPAAS